MARHRSPLGRRAHLGPPLYAVTASAGAGGVGRSFPLPQLPLRASPLPAPARRRSTRQRSTRQRSTRPASDLSAAAQSLPVRFVATALAGSALAAAGQVALTDALPAATDGANVLRLGVEGFLGGPTTTAPAAPPVPAVSIVEPAVTVSPVSPVATEPAVADATGLVKAAELQRLAAEADAIEAARVAEQARAAEAERVAELARAAEAERVAEPAPARAAGADRAPTGGAVQLVVGRVSSGFGLRGGTLHAGLDIAAPIGTPIRAPLDGTVINSGPASGFGLWVRVRHADGTITVYGHIDRSLVTVGQQVSAGEVIAEVGNRGQSTGPHVHFEVITPAGSKIDPGPWLDERGIGY